MLARGKAPHDAVRDALMRMVVQCGMADAAVVETPVTSADGSSTVADVVYLDSLSEQRVILEVLVVTMSSDSSLAAGAIAGLGEFERSCRRERGRSAIMASSKRC